MLTDKIALVTGASSGIGRAIALKFAADGAKVIVHANRNEAGATETVELIRDMDREATFLLADFADSATLPAFCDKAWAWKGSLDIVVNNAGVDVLTGDARDWSFEQKLAALLDVDVKATMQISRNLGAKMREMFSTQEPATGAILTTGWDQALCGMEGDSGEMFGAIKSAVIGFSKSLACSLAPHVRVNCLAPGWIQTSWGDDASDYWNQRAISESLLGRWGRPEDVATAAAFLASDDASFINGQVIPINGGFRNSSFGNDGFRNVAES